MNRLNYFSKYCELRKDFPFLSYDLYHYYFTGNSLELEFSFNLSNKYIFRPHISIPNQKNLFLPDFSLSEKAMQNLVFHIGMIELISYWKAACPPQLIILPHSMTEVQSDFWKKIYFNGLGEFFYLNSITSSRDDFMQIEVSANTSTEKFKVEKKAGSLVPVGGGKDSAVTMGLLNRAGKFWLPFSINPNETTTKVIHAAGKDETQTIIIRREIDQGLLELNKKGFLNGHTPFSALLGFYSLLIASLSGITDIILSNESSANEATVPGTNINHQYSKSVEFEADFRNYIRDYISEDLNYFSLLRPLSELQIGGLFSEMDEFHHSFKSCNVGSRQNIWCCRCPKCLFTFIVLSPFIEPVKLVKIFGKNLFEDDSLSGILEQLNGQQEVKPFECIGTVYEVNIALDKAIEKYPDGKLPVLLKKHLAYRQNGLLSYKLDEPTKQSASGHFIPEEYLKLLSCVL